MKDKKFLFISGIIVFLTLVLSFYGYHFIEKQAIVNMKNSDKEPIYFGATYMTMNNPYFVVLNNEIKNVVEANGDVLITLDPALSIDKQVEQVRYLMNQDVKVLFVNALDADALDSVLQECYQKGIIVIAVDTNLKDKEYVDFTVISDNYQAGVEAAKEMMKEYDYARIVLLEHSAAVSAKNRIQGFVDTISNNCNYEIVAREECEGQLEIATPVMNDVIQRGIDFDVVMALNDPAALGAMAAMQEAGISNVSVFGVDGTPEIKALIDEGREIVTVAQSPIQMGKKAIEVAYDLLAGDTYQNNIYLIPVTLITENNIDDFSLDGWQ